MPLYEYRCEKGHVTEQLRLLRFRKRKARCGQCGQPASVVLSIPRIASWSSDWRFPNLRKSGDGAMSFESKSDYDNYLVDNEILEIGGAHVAPNTSKQRYVIRGDALVEIP